MITLASIEADPTLSTVLGANARSLHDAAFPERPWNDELQLLVVYLLYMLSRSSNVEGDNFGPFLGALLSAPVDAMPFMWKKEDLHMAYPDPADKIRVTAEAISYDVREMYVEIVPLLVESHPDIFAPKKKERKMRKQTTDKSGGTGKDDVGTVQGHPPVENESGTKPGEKTEWAEEQNEEWAYSFEKFLWAYAMVNSRHWNLPCADVDSALAPAMVGVANKTIEATQTTAKKLPRPHAWMAPIADMLNFGPACTKAAYNHKTKSFEITATCNLVLGQEITFWYTDECEDIVVANFGFTSSLLDTCLSAEEWRDRSEQWQAHAKILEERLLEAWNEADDLRRALEKSRGEHLGEGDYRGTDDTRMRGGGRFRDSVEEGL